MLEYYLKIWIRYCWRIVFRRK